MIAIVGIVISIFALAVSAATAWITLFRRGRILMTQPTVIYFGADGSRFGLEPRHQKIFFRTLLYSTGKRGHIVENMFITLRRGETRQNFNIWVYGDDELRRGSMLPEIGGIPEHVWEIADNSQDADQLLLYKDLIILIKELPPAYRTVFNLYIIDGYTHSEIADLMKIAIGTSKSNLSKARVLLQKSIKKMEEGKLCRI